MNRQAQMEIIGLVVIVILISLGILFMVQFALNEDSSKKIFTRKGLASSTVSSVLKMSVIEPGCDYYPTPLRLGEDLLEDCALNPPEQRYSNEKYHCRNLNSCEFLNQFISEQLTATLGQWGKKYEFTALLVGEDGYLVEIKTPGGCPKTAERDTSGAFYLSTEVGLVQTQLYLCD